MRSRVPAALIVVALGFCPAASAEPSVQEIDKKLEAILRQLRDEEIERVLAALQARCEHMLRLQKEVYEGTQQVDQTIGGNAGKKATHAEETRSLQLSDRERDIVGEADKVIQLLEAEGSAVAFPEVFTQLRDDMKTVGRRLAKADVGTVTQVIEQDVIADLKEMVAALKKAREGSSHQPPTDATTSPPKDPALIETLAELKMIRSMQKRVNSRTETYGERYVGEQTSQPEIRQELQDLSDRQKRIFRVNNDMYRGMNK